MSQFGVIGDQDFGTDIPVMEVPKEDLIDEKNRAKFSKSKEFKLLKEHLQERIAFHQTYLPNGEAVIGKDIDLAQVGQRWMVSNAVIAELQMVIDSYENAQEVVRNAGL